MLELIQQQVADALKTGDPIYYERFNANGDNMIQHWAFLTVLQKFANESGIDSPQINLKTYQGHLFRKSQNPDLSQMARHSGFRSSHLIGFVKDRIMVMNKLLGMETYSLPQNLIPQPMQTDFAPFTTFDRNLVIDTGEQLRAQLLNRASKIVTIGQFGGVAEKRLSNEQVGLVAQTAKSELPDCHVTVVSDKEILTKTKPPFWQRFINGDAYYAFPYFDSNFKASLDKPYGPAVDQVVSAVDINRFAAQFYASDILTTPDNFAAWLGSGSLSMRPDHGGGLKPDTVHVHYTMANPRIWQIEGATISSSAAIQMWDKATMGNFVFVPYDTYYNRSGVPFEPPLDSSRRGITTGDLGIYQFAFEKHLKAHSEKYG